MKPAMKQLCLDFGQRELGAVTCSRCGMVYQHEAEDELVHRKHCKALAAESAVRNDPEAAFVECFFSKQMQKCIQRKEPCRSFSDDTFAHVLSPAPPALTALLSSMQHLCRAPPHVAADDDEHGVYYRPAHFYAAAEKIPDGASLIVFASLSERRVLGSALFSGCKNFVPTALLEGANTDEQQQQQQQEHPSISSQNHTEVDSCDDEEDGRDRSPSPAPVDAEAHSVRIRGVNVKAILWDAMFFPSAATAAVSAAAASSKKAKSAVNSTPSVASFFGGGGSLALSALVSNTPHTTKSSGGSKKPPSKAAASSTTPSITSFFKPQIRQREDGGEQLASDASTSPRPIVAAAALEFQRNFFRAVPDVVCAALHISPTLSRAAFAFADPLFDSLPQQAHWSSPVHQMLGRNPEETGTEVQPVVVARLTPRVMGFATLENEIEVNDDLKDEPDPYFRVKWM